LMQYIRPCVKKLMIGGSGFGRFHIAGWSQPKTSGRSDIRGVRPANPRLSPWFR
jgi:hypothetical protein